MKGKTVVITGGTSGIGEVAARQLAAIGARIVLIARDPLRVDGALDRIAGPNANVEIKVYYADLFSLAAVKRVAAEIAAAEPTIDVLINNAGALFETRETTVDGLERTFALNHMAYFVLTNGLLANLKPGARIISTASDAHKMARLDFDDLQAEHNYKGFRVYGTSKLCNILFTRELARRLEGTGITAVCLHPGFVATRFAANNDGLLGKTFAVLKKIAAISPEAGARTIIYLASAPKVDGRGGTYWYKCKPIAPTRAGRSNADAKRLWNISERIARG
jgi:NAD(P)-dependent dehydrogenase (short-subunit alcohol dehydrogenase family)